MKNVQHQNNDIKKQRRLNGPLFDTLLWMIVFACGSYFVKVQCAAMIEATHHLATLLIQVTTAEAIQAAILRLIWPVIMVAMLSVMTLWGLLGIVKTLCLIGKSKIEAK